MKLKLALRGTDIWKGFSFFLNSAVDHPKKSENKIYSEFLVNDVGYVDLSSIFISLTRKRRKKQLT